MLQRFRVITSRTNILFVEHKEVFGGGQVFLLNLATHLNKDEFQIHVLCSPNPRLTQQFGAHGIDIQELSLGRIQKSSNPFLIVANLWWRIRPTLKVLSAIKRFNIDLVCANDVFSFIACVFATKLSGRKSVLIVHNTTYPGAYSTRWILRAADRIVAVSTRVRDHVLSILPSAKSKTSVIQNGIEVNVNGDSARKAKPSMRRKKKMLVGTVSRLSREKGLDVFLQSLPEVFDRIPNIKAVIAGEGPQETELKDLSRELGLNGRLEFRGFVSDPLKIMSTFDIFVLSSRAEGLPLAVLEAMSLSKPVVATDVGDVKEVIGDDCGTVVASEDPRALSNAIIGLLSNRKRREAMGKQGQRVVRERFTLSSTVSQYEEAFLSLVGDA